MSTAAAPAATVTTTEAGRSGDVRYTEADRSITGWWEFAGGDAVAIVHMGSTTDWRTRHPWAVGQRAAILRHVADELVRQKARGCSADIDEDGGWITLRG